MRPTCFLRLALLHSFVLVFALAGILYPAGEISAALVTIPGLYNTGVDNNGQILKDNDPEIHYILTGETSGAFVISNSSKPGPWKPALGQSNWIGPEGGSTAAPAGNYVYTLTFSLDGLDPSTAIISGTWASDNSSEIYINDWFTENSVDGNDFVRYTSFTIDSGFNAGDNTLEFRVTNSPPDGNPSGLLVFDIRGSAAEVPIPGAVWLLGPALLLFIAVRRKTNR